MAKPSIQLIQVLRNTATKLEKSSDYQWGHMGSCNCGFLAQELTKLTKHQIHARAMQRYGNWSDQLNDYCPTSGLLIDDLITQLVDNGFDVDDLKHLEMLSDPEVLRHLPSKRLHLARNEKSDVVEYLMTWALTLEEQLLESVDFTDVFQEEKRVLVSPGTL
jgi:hypothetical protein